MLFEDNIKLSLEEVSTFTKEIIDKLQASGIDEDALFDVRLCLEEALINAVKYGNKKDPSKRVFIRIVSEPDKIEMEVKDEGQGFDYERLPLPTEDQNLEKLSGRGVFLIKNLMNRVEYLDRGSRIKMIKYLGGGNNNENN